ncbi:hypothetical protein [Sphingobacterium sp. BIGb0116]|uniref:hypothetical protein n=1 Tax=Sphingobacterium sp. BIGb0116 TaxID=2940619 RepID=UPI002169881A|nr:hypothetical protein [Sphingobacterium sp. BIGb0116]MCS4164435.1 hypothetical protein [Sphingobacterium sp. BIGb0116]
MSTFSQTVNFEIALNETEEIKIDAKIVFTSKNDDVTDNQKKSLKELKRSIEQFLIDYFD